MALPTLVTSGDFTSSIYADLADQTDVLLTDILASAEADVVREIGYPILATTYTEQFTARSQTLFVKHRNIQSITSIRKRVAPFSSWMTVGTTEYRFESGPAYIEVFSPLRGMDVEVTYVAGFVEVPLDIKLAIIKRTALMLGESSDLELYGAGDSKEPGTAYIARDIKRLIAPYKLTSTPYR